MLIKAVLKFKIENYFLNSNMNALYLILSIVFYSHESSGHKDRHQSPHA